MRYLLISVRLILLLTAVAGRAQQRPAGAPVSAPAPPSTALDCQVLTGRVTDPFAYPLTGATIMLRSPGQGFSLDVFSTNAEGHYMITSKLAIPRNTVMEVTAVGYAPLELALTSCTPLDLTMMPLKPMKYKVKSRNKKNQNDGKVR
ncbi:MAG: carboxypeptidase-like regulatory domain-containing protein [Bacteroidota bacterium]|nr:carboxypeptidase-like regulatory domain-containing protein [Bacteroidota bacterium]